MVALPRPPATSDPDAFFVDYLPKLAATLLEGLPLLSPIELVVRLLPDCSYTTTLGETGLMCRRGTPSGAPLVELSCSRVAWRDQTRHLLPRVLQIVESEWPRLKSQLEHVLAASLPRITDALFDCPGILEVELTDDAGDTNQFVYTIAGGSGPRARVSLTEAEIEKLLEGRMRLAQFLASQLRIEGDAAYLLRLVRAGS